MNEHVLGGLGVVFMFLAVFGMRWFTVNDFKSLTAQNEIHNRKMIETVEELQKKLDELRLQVGILNHGARVIPMPFLTPQMEEQQGLTAFNKDGSQRKKPGPKPKHLENKKPPQGDSGAGEPSRTLDF